MTVIHKFHPYLRALICGPSGPFILLLMTQTTHIWQSFTTVPFKPWNFDLWAFWSLPSLTAQEAHIWHTWPIHFDLRAFICGPYGTFILLRHKQHKYDSHSQVSFIPQSFDMWFFWSLSLTAQSNDIWSTWLDHSNLTALNCGPSGPLNFQSFIKFWWGMMMLALLASNNTISRRFLTKTTKKTSFFSWLLKLSFWSVVYYIHAI